jgi:hypothetical protein
MYDYILALLCAIFVNSVLVFLMYVHSNWISHTPEWHNQKLIEWLNRPLPTLEEKYRKEIRNSYDSEEWAKYPHCLIDAICDPKEDADEVIRWVEYYV